MTTGIFDGMTVLSLEQALSMPYCTYRMGLMGARVIRIEAPRGDPNRYVGSKIADEKAMRTYYLGFNAGKESITLNLKNPVGPKLLHDLVSRLQPDIFCTNQLPGKYAKLGVDYETLRGIREDLVWCGISGFGPKRSQAAYDPMVQAETGLMYVTGEAQRDPMGVGVPIVDLGAANEAVTQILAALLLRERTGQGSCIDVPMARASLSLLCTQIHQAALGTDVSRTGNTHRFFGPVDVFETTDGHVLIAVGNDRQWKALVGFEGFEKFDKPRYERNEGRVSDSENLHPALAEVTREHTCDQLVELFKKANIAISRVNTMQDIFEDPFLRKMMMSSKDPIHGTELCLAPSPHDTPPSLEPLPYPPRLGEHNQAIYQDLLGRNIDELQEQDLL